MIDEKNFVSRDSIDYYQGMSVNESEGEEVRIQVDGLKEDANVNTFELTQSRYYTKEHSLPSVASPTGVQASLIIDSIFDSNCDFVNEAMDQLKLQKDIARFAIREGQPGNISNVIRMANFISKHKPATIEVLKPPTSKEIQAEIEKICEECDIPIPTTENQNPTTSDLFVALVNRSMNPYLEYKKCDNIERTLIKRRYMQPPKSKMQRKLERQIKKIKQGLEAQKELEQIKTINSPKSNIRSQVASPCSSNQPQSIESDFEQSVSYFPMLTTSRNNTNRHDQLQLLNNDSILSVPESKLVKSKKRKEKFRSEAFLPRVINKHNMQESRYSKVNMFSAEYINSKLNTKLYPIANSTRSSCLETSQRQNSQRSIYKFTNQNQSDSLYSLAKQSQLHLNESQLRIQCEEKSPIKQIQTIIKSVNEVRFNKDQTQSSKLKKIVDQSNMRQLSLKFRINSQIELSERLDLLKVQEPAVLQHMFMAEEETLLNDTEQQRDVILKHKQHKEDLVYNYGIEKRQRQQMQKVVTKYKNNKNN